MERKPYESIHAVNCISCGTEPGKLHAYGCTREKCPECGKQLITCSCMILSVADSIHLLNTIAATMDFEQVTALMNVSETSGSGELNQSYKEKAAMLYFYRNTDDRELMQTYRVSTPEKARTIAAVLEFEELTPGGSTIETGGIQ